MDPHRVIIADDLELKPLVVDRILKSLALSLPNININDPVVHRPLQRQLDVRSNHLLGQVPNLNDVEQALLLELHLLLMRGGLL